MKRPATRLLTTVAAGAVLAAVVGAAPAGAATTGVGTTNTKTSVVTVQLGSNGSLLNLGLLTDIGSANIDPHAGTLQAATSLVPVTLSVPALHLNASSPAVATQSPGGSGDSAGQALTLGSLGVPATLATATLKAAALHSSYAAGAAHSTMTAAEVDGLTLAGGALASVDLLSSNLGADAITAQADGARGVKVGTIKLLDLGALLKGLGIDASTLPLATVSQLVSQLHLPVAGLPTGSSLASEATGISTTVTALQQSIAGGSQVTQPVDQAAQGVLGGLHLPVPGVGAAASQVTAEIGQLQTTLTNLLTGALSGLDSMPLVQIAATQLGVTTKAADTVADSAAGVSVAPLTVTVAGTQLPTIDAGAAVSTINGVVSQANGALGGLLTTLGLPTNLVSLSLLDKATNVAQQGDYTNAAAGVTLLTAKIAAINPSVITGALSKLGSSTPVGSLLGGTPLSGVLGASSSMGTLDGLVGQAAPLLSGAQVQVASLAGASTYTFSPVSTQTPAAAPPTNLPHTGGNPALAIIGVLLAAAALGLVRWARLSRTQAHSGIAD